MAWISGLVERVSFYSAKRSIDEQMEDRVRVELSIWRIDDAEIQRDFESNNSLSVFRRDIEIESDREYYLASITVGKLVKFEVQWDDSKWDQFYCRKGGWIFSSFESSSDDKQLLDSSIEYLKIAEPKNDWDFIETVDFKCKANTEQYDNLINTLKGTVTAPWGEMRTKLYIPTGFNRTVRFYEKINDNQNVGLFNLWPYYLILYYDHMAGGIGLRGDGEFVGNFLVEEFYEKYLSPACVSLGLQPSFIKEKISIPRRSKKEPLMLNSVGLCKPKYEFQRKNEKAWSVDKFVSDPVYVEALGTEMVFEIDMISLGYKNARNSIDSAISKFLKADKQFILQAEDYMWCYHYFMMKATGTVFVKKKKDLWKEFYFPRTVHVEALKPDLIRRKRAYLELSACSCSWETHGLDLGFLNGSKLVKVGETGSSLSEYLKNDSGVFGASSEQKLIKIEDSFNEQDYPNYHFV